MRVLCISTPKNKVEKLFKTPSIVIEGQSYNVIDEMDVYNDGDIYYELQEHLNHLYHSKLFIPCSEKENVVLEDVLVETNKTDNYGSNSKFTPLQR